MEFRLPKQIGKENYFHWGPVVYVYTVGPYDIVEYHPHIFDKRGHGTRKYEIEKVQFHPYIDGKDTNTSFHSLDAALIGAIANRRLGCGNHATHFVCKMLEIKEEDE